MAGKISAAGFPDDRLHANGLRYVLETTLELYDPVLMMANIGLDCFKRYSNLFTLQIASLTRVADAIPDLSDCRTFQDCSRSLRELTWEQSDWTGMSEIIVALHSNPSAPELPSSVIWSAWASQVHQLGKQVGEAVMAFRDSIRYGAGEEGIDNLIARLREIDDLLVQVGFDQSERLSDGLSDSLVAMSEIEKRGATPNSDTTKLFTAEARARRIARSFPQTRHAPETQNALQINIGRKPTALALTLFLILVSFVFLALGWQASQHEPGTLSDADFWFLIQSMLMQGASIVPLMLGFRTNPVQNRQVSRWIWTLTTFSSICTLLAPFLYIAAPTEYSAVIASFGSATLAFIVLEAMFIPDQVKKKTDQADRWSLQACLRAVNRSLHGQRHRKTFPSQTRRKDHTSRRKTNLSITF